MAKKKYQIFISSTYEDLKEERNAVLKAILKMKHFPIGMEMFNAGNTQQWKIITDTIDSSDYYVLILGTRYGSILEDGDERGISYTEREYRYAVQRKIPVIAFIIDDNANVKAKNVETDSQKQKRLEKFKNDVKSHYMVEWFKTPDDLANRVTIALYQEFEYDERPGWVRNVKKISLKASELQIVEKHNPREHPKIFISYSWTSDSYADKVRELAERLVEDGINVILDQWDLKPGQDIYRFMEKCIKDPNIVKVLILCDKRYVERADGRVGGIGTETTIITSEVYKDAEQTKFIPVVMERDEDERPYLPFYLRSRYFIDLSNGDKKAYDTLLMAIYE